MVINFKKSIWFTVKKYWS